MTDPADVVRTHLAAFDAGDLDRMLATLSPDADFVTGSTRVEPAEFAEFFGWAIREIDPSMRITTLVADGDAVAVEFVESVTMDGPRRDLNRAAFYRVRDGVIVAARVYDERAD